MPLTLIPKFLPIIVILLVFPAAISGGYTCCFEHLDPQEPLARGKAARFHARSDLKHVGLVVDEGGVRPGGRSALNRCHHLPVLSPSAGTGHHSEQLRCVQALRDEQ
jgi:hypothetical protein